MLRNYIRPLLAHVFANTSKAPNRKFTPRRAVLYVPGDDSKKTSKAFSLDIDCIVLDCEDGVSLNKKVQARLNIRDILDKGKPSKKRRYDFVVRVNAVASQILKDDLRVVLTGKNLPDTIFLPKVEGIDDLKLFSEYLDEYMTKGKVDLIIGIESAISLINSVEICKTALKMSVTSKFTPAALLFGSDDYCAAIGARRSESSIELTYARQKIVTVAKAFNLQAIDMVYIMYEDTEGLKRQAEEGARFGFTGKQIIHPGQVEITQKAFLPTKKEIEWATNVLKSFDKHQKEGVGAFTYKGAMIDMPTMRQAQHIIDLITAVLMQE